MAPPPRIKQCPVQMEAELVEAHEMISDVQKKKKRAVLMLKLEMLKVYIAMSYGLRNLGTRLMWRG
jgi:hypothetical protein